jgi:hypothetical protein
MNESTDDASTASIDDARAVRILGAIRKLSQDMTLLRSQIAFRRGRLAIPTAARDFARDADDTQVLTLLTTIEEDLRTLFVDPVPVPPTQSGKSPVDPQPPVRAGQGNQESPQSGSAKYNCPHCGTEMIVTPKI